MTDEIIGFWHQVGAPATVDWCEGNYLVTRWIAEWWNTLTSFILCLAALGGVWRCRRADFHVEGRFQAVFWIIALVGAGSMGFHGTLLRSMQVMDELPMVYGSLGLLYCARFRKARPDLRPEDGRSMMRWRVGLVLYAVGFTTAYFLHEATFLIFVATFALASTILAVWGLYIAHEKGVDPVLRRIIYTSVVAFGAAVFAFWIPERHFPCDHGFQAIEPHAIFHLLAMVGTYGGNLGFIFDRQACLGRAPVLDLSAPTPFVRVRDGQA